MAEWDGLENRCTREGTVGSNPTPSAKISLFFNGLPPSPRISTKAEREKFPEFASHLQTFRLGFNLAKSFLRRLVVQAFKSSPINDLKLASILSAAAL